LPLTLSILEAVAGAQDIIAQSKLPKETVDAMKRESVGLEREAKGVGAAGVADVMEDIRRRGQNVVILPFDAGIIDLTNDVNLLLPSKNRTFHSIFCCFILFNFWMRTDVQRQ
jgi:hypothetical protein